MVICEIMSSAVLISGLIVYTRQIYKKSKNEQKINFAIGSSYEEYRKTNEGALSEEDTLRTKDEVPEVNSISPD